MKAWLRIAGQSTSITFVFDNLDVRDYASLLDEVSTIALNYDGEIEDVELKT